MSWWILQQLSPQTLIRNKCWNIQKMSEAREKNSIKNMEFLDTETNVLIFSCVWTMIQTFIFIPWGVQLVALIMLSSDQQHSSAIPNVPITNKAAAVVVPKPNQEPGDWSCLLRSSSLIHLDLYTVLQVGHCFLLLFAFYTHHKRNVTLLNVLNFSVRWGCVTWELFTFNKIENESFIVPHCYFLCFMSCMQSDRDPRNRMEPGKYFACQGKECWKGCAGITDHPKGTHISFSFFLAEILVLKLRFLRGDFLILVIQSLL